MMQSTAWTRTFAGSVTTIEPDTSIRSRILTGNTASSGADEQTSPCKASWSSTVITGGGTFSSGVCAQEALAATDATRRHASSACLLTAPERPVMTYHLPPRKDASQVDGVLRRSGRLAALPTAARNAS